MAIDKVCEIEKCTGCGVCSQVCQHSAISMQPDAEGFLHPVISNTNCVTCGMCQYSCPVNNLAVKRKPLKVYSGWSNDGHIRMDSSSGGAFTEIARPILAKGGVVFGVAMDEKQQARHIHIETETELSKLRGSKYVQSIIGNSYKEAKQFLQSGREVLFSGTPCQIAGLHNYLRKEYDNLTTVDLICHGVPSPKVFEDYKTWIEKLIKERITDIKFRCKKSSWIFYNMGINPHVEKNGNIKYSYTGSYYADPYIRAFLRDNILRPNCYHCQYASIRRVSDFTIADWWGYKGKSAQDKDFDRKGVSLIMCNTEKAVNIVKMLDMKLDERTLEEAIRTNHSLKHPFDEPKTRNEFWTDYAQMPFQDIVKKWMYPEKIPLSTYIRIYHGERRLLYNLLNLYERIVNKLKLKKLIIRIQAK